ncbi:hypothetical protein L7F22_013037 [Adiantum nelumboides]|nr:hypothetical protein [Adiantum nelumboides]
MPLPLSLWNPLAYLAQLYTLYLEHDGGYWRKNSLAHDTFVTVFAIVLAGFGLQRVFASRLPDMAARTLEFELFVTRFDGSDFAWWSSHMLDALTCLSQALPLQGKDARPESMSDSAWEDLDALARSTIMLSLVESIYCIVMHARTTRDVWQQLCQRYGTSEPKDALRARCRMQQRRRQHRLVATALTTLEADVVYEVTYNSEVILASMCTPEVLMSCDGTLPSQWMLDTNASFHVSSILLHDKSSDTEMMTCVDDRHDDALRSFMDMPLPITDNLSHGTSCVDVIARETDACEPCMAMLIDTESVDEPDFWEPKVDVLFYDAFDMFEDDSVIQTPMYAHGESAMIADSASDLGVLSRELLSIGVMSTRLACEGIAHGGEQEVDTLLHVWLDVTSGSDPRTVLGTGASLIEHESSLRLLLLQ